MVWFCLVWSGLVWDNIPSEASVKVCSRFNLFWLFQRRFSVGLVFLGLVWLSMVWFGSREHQSEASVKVSSRSILFWLFLEKIGIVWFGLVWLGSVWDNIHLKLLWKFHQDPTCFRCFREDLELVWIGMVWCDLRKHPSEASERVSSRSDFFLGVVEKIIGHKFFNPIYVWN